MGVKMRTRSVVCHVQYPQRVDTVGCHPSHKLETGGLGRSAVWPQTWRAALAPARQWIGSEASLDRGACGRADANAQNIQARSYMIHDWPTYALVLQRLVGDGATAPTDCASMWLVLHKHGQPVALIADVLLARFSSLVDARQFEAAQSCGRLMIDAAQQSGSSATMAHARHLRYRLHAAQNEHAAAARELEASLALAPSSRPHLWVELARARYALKGEEAGALLGAAEALERRSNPNRHRHRHRHRYSCPDR